MGNAMINSNRQGWGLFEDMAVGFGIGALAGVTGAYTGGLVSVAPGFIGGTVSMASGGFAGGFVGGAGMAWAKGANFGQGLQAGVQSGFMGAAIGGVMGGVISGIDSYNHYGNFWTGNGYCNEISSGVYSQETSIAETRATNYNNSISTEGNDISLQNRFNEELNTKIGDYNIRDITTRTGRYGLLDNGKHLNFRTNEVVLGFSDPNIVIPNSPMSSSIHISPYGLNLNSVNFKAIAGHELFHSIQTFNGLTNKYFKEAAAYKYTKNVYYNAGYSGFHLETYRYPYYPSNYYVNVPFNY